MWLYYTLYTTFSSHRRFCRCFLRPAAAIVASIVAFDFGRFASWLLAAAAFACGAAAEAAFTACLIVEAGGFVVAAAVVVAAGLAHRSKGACAFAAGVLFDAAAAACALLAAAALPCMMPKLAPRPLPTRVRFASAAVCIAAVAASFERAALLNGGGGGGSLDAVAAAGGCAVPATRSGKSSPPNRSTAMSIPPGRDRKGRGGVCQWQLGCVLCLACCCCFAHPSICPDHRQMSPKERTKPWRISRPPCLRASREGRERRRGWRSRGVP